MDYLAIKHLHVTCVSLSIALFVLRGGLQVAGVAWRRWRVLRILPHVVDSMLLASAIWLAWTIQQYPFGHDWLTAKLLALIAYILIGKAALADSTPANRRPFLFVAALGCVGYIVGVALTHSPSWGLLR